MAVYTEIADDELEAFLNAYDLGPILALKGIAEGVSNSNFFLQTTGGRYILTLYEKRVDEADLPYFMALMEHMALKGVTCPAPIHGRDGAVIRRLAGRSAALFSFLDGVSPKRPGVAHCGEAGRALAELHIAGGDFAMRRPNALSLESWKSMAAETFVRASEVSRGLGDEIAAELALLETAWPQGLPSGVTHADLFPDNTLYVGQTLTGVIDFYFACDEAFAYDLAVCLNAWCFEGDGSFNMTKGRALIARYQAVRPLLEAERAALPVLARGSALRFLLTRLYDWLNRDAGALVVPKNPMECLAMLRFHQTVTGAGDYGV